MLGIIIYEIFDVLYHVGKIGYNCVDYGISTIYNRKPYDEIKNSLDMEGEMYLERIIKLENRLRKLENMKS
tara:strand:- start:5598 stop:5810 length:213 start_codon:yes stop_codon:yes gene_type:complete